MIDCEVLQDTAIRNSAVPASGQRVSTQLYYMLVLLFDGDQRNACWNMQARWLKGC